MPPSAHVRIPACGSAPAAGGFQECATSGLRGRQRTCGHAFPAVCGNMHDAIRLWAHHFDLEDYVHISRGIETDAGSEIR
jgi:hypothetical protein